MTLRLEASPFVILPVNTVSVDLGLDQSICEGSDVVLTATPSGVTTIASYEWVDLNTGLVVSTTGPDYTIVDLSSDMNIGVTITSGDECTNGVTALDEVIITMLPTLFASAEFESVETEICEGATVTYNVINPVNTGLNPTWEWTVTGAVGQVVTGTGAAFETFTYTPAIGDVVSLTVVSDELCADLTPVDAVLMNTLIINPVITTAVTIDSDDADNSICEGTAVTFTATPGNVLGAETYQWYLNGVAQLGETGVTYTTSGLQDNDVLSVEMNGDNACEVQDIVASSDIVMDVQPTTTVNVTISANPGLTACQGSDIVLTAT